MIVGIVVAIVFTAIAFGVQIVYLTTLSGVLKQCDPRNRSMEPGQVYLNLIPCFGAVWIFITVNRISESLRHEYDDRGIDAPGDYGHNLGVTYAALVLAGLIPYIGALFGLAGLVCWILYWVKMAEYKRELAEGESFRDEEDGQYRKDRRFRDDDRYDDREEEEDDRRR